MLPIGAIIKIFKSGKTLKEIIRGILPSSLPDCFNKEVFDKVDKELKEKMNQRVENINDRERENN
jgi:hypothetical protein